MKIYLQPLLSPVLRLVDSVLATACNLPDEPLFVEAPRLFGVGMSFFSMVEVLSLP